MEFLFWMNLVILSLLSVAGFVGFFKRILNNNRQLSTDNPFDNS